MAQRPIFSISLRCSSVMPLVRPPGMEVQGCTLRPPMISTTCVAVLAHLDDLAADFQPDFMDDAQNVAFSNGGIRAHDEVRAAQGIEVGGMVGAVKGHVEQFAQFLGRGGDIHMIDRVRRLWQPPCGALPGRHRRCGWSAGAFPPPGGRRRSVRSRAVPGSGNRYWRHRLLHSGRSRSCRGLPAG